MTYAMQWVFEEFVKTLNSEKICKACKDPDPSKYSIYPFHKKEQTDSSLPLVVQNDNAESGMILFGLKKITYARGWVLS